MKVSFKITKKDLPRLIAALVLAGLGIAFSVSAFYDAVIWFVLLFALTFITVTIDSEATGKKKARQAHSRDHPSGVRIFLQHLLYADDQSCSPQLIAG